MEYLADAEEFAQKARGAKTSHSEAKSVAYAVSEKVGDAFTEFMDICHGSYDRENGERVKRALELMGEMVDEISRELAR